MRKSYQITQIEPGTILNHKTVKEWRISNTTDQPIVSGKRLTPIIITFTDDSKEFAYLEELFN